MERAFTFAVEEGATGWNLVENNMCQDPIPPEPVALNEARLLCREAMTLITEEVSVRASESNHGPLYSRCCDRLHDW